MNPITRALRSLTTRRCDRCAEHDLAHAALEAVRRERAAQAQKAEAERLKNRIVNGRDLP